MASDPLVSFIFARLDEDQSDPSPRAQAEVAMKRDMVELALGLEPTPERNPLARDILEVIAQVWSDHPDYPAPRSDQSVESIQA